MRFIHAPLAAALALLPAAASAQVYLHGTVVEDATGVPVVNATVVLQDSRGREMQRQIADDAGHFAFAVVGMDAVRLRAERIGYRTVTTPVIRFEGFTVFTLEVRLDVSAVLLAPLTVKTRSRTLPAPTLTGFERRRDGGNGWFMSRDEIFRRNASLATDLLVNVPGIWLERGQGTMRRQILMARGAARCRAHIFIDGVHVNRPMGNLAGRRGITVAETVMLDDMVPPDAIHGIEVYQGMSRLPAEFVTPEITCGVVAIWTRRGGDG
jgi:hypothetical protein